MRKVILVVDDEVDLRDSLVELFENEGHETHACGDLAVARDLFDAIEPHTVLVDWYLRGESADEFVAAILAHARVVVFSASPSARAEAERHGVAFVAKPFEIEHLLAAISG
jgi:DNA-binding response OmpR family regulator